MTTTVYKSEHNGNARIKWNQRVVLQTAKQYCNLFLFAFIVLHIIQITYIMYNVQVYLGSL